MKKLVRDFIPDIINRSGRTASYYQSNEDEFRALLKKKLIEEVNEFLESESLEELADILEVIDAICTTYCFDKNRLNQIKQEKNIEKGSFNERIVLVSISKTLDNDLNNKNATL